MRLYIVLYAQVMPISATELELILKRLHARNYVYTFKNKYLCMSFRAR